MTRRILVVDESPLTARQLAAHLEEDDWEVEAEGSPGRVLELIRSGGCRLVVMHWAAGQGEAPDLLRAIRLARLPVGVLVLSSVDDTGRALDAMKAGADDFVTHPVDPGRLRLIVRRVFERQVLMDELEQLRHHQKLEHGFHDLVSKSPKMRKVFDLIERVGPLDSAVLIQGETGTGKDLAARAIHRVSGRRGQWVVLNCAALRDSLLESELFGHEKGAFTGADRSRQGRFEQADGGTIFLDEVAEIPAPLQAKLLRVLQSGEFERVGGTRTLKVDVRVVSASNRRLEEEVAAGRFRSDLYYRLCVLKLELPALRERREDIPLLANHFLDRLRAHSTPPVTRIDPEAMQALIEHQWPGNVRELENAIKAAVAMADGTILSREALPGWVVPRDGKQAAPARPLIDIDRPMPEVASEIVSQVEREYFGQLLARYRGNVARCARHSGLSRRCVTQKLSRYGLDREEFRLSPSEERRLAGVGGRLEGHAETHQGDRRIG